MGYLGDYMEAYHELLAEELKQNVLGVACA